MYFFFFLMIRRPPRSTLFPTRRSSDLGGFVNYLYRIFLIYHDISLATIHKSVVSGIAKAHTIGSQKYFLLGRVALIIDRGQRTIDFTSHVSGVDNISSIAVNPQLRTVIVFLATRCKGRSEEHTSELQSRQYL